MKLAARRSEAVVTSHAVGRVLVWVKPRRFGPVRSTTRNRGPERGSISRGRDSGFHGYSGPYKSKGQRACGPYQSRSKPYGSSAIRRQQIASSVYGGRGHRQAQAILWGCAQLGRWLNYGRKKVGPWIGWNYSRTRISLSTCRVLF